MHFASHHAGWRLCLARLRCPVGLTRTAPSGNADSQILGLPVLLRLTAINIKIKVLRQLFVSTVSINAFPAKFCSALRAACYPLCAAPYRFLRRITSSFTAGPPNIVFSDGLFAETFAGRDPSRTLHQYESRRRSAMLSCPSGKRRSNPFRRPVLIAEGPCVVLSTPTRLPSATRRSAEYQSSSPPPQTGISGVKPVGNAISCWRFAVWTASTMASIFFALKTESAHPAGFPRTYTVLIRLHSSWPDRYQSRPPPCAFLIQTVRKLTVPIRIFCGNSGKCCGSAENASTRERITPVFHNYPSTDCLSRDLTDPMCDYRAY